MTSDLSSKIVQVEGRGRGGRVEFGTRTELEIRALVDPGPPPSLPHARTPPPGQGEGCHSCVRPTGTLHMVTGYKGPGGAGAPVVLVKGNS